jgi:hypothetical protein
MLPINSTTKSVIPGTSNWTVLRSVRLIEIDPCCRRPPTISAAKVASLWQRHAQLRTKLPCVSNARKQASARPAEGPVLARWRRSGPVSELALSTHCCPQPTSASRKYECATPELAGRLVPDSLIHAMSIEKRDHSLKMVWRPIRLWLCETYGCNAN